MRDDRNQRWRDHALARSWARSPEICMGGQPAIRSKRRRRQITYLESEWSVRARTGTAQGRDMALLFSTTGPAPMKRQPGSGRRRRSGSPLELGAGQTAPVPAPPAATTPDEAGQPSTSQPCGRPPPAQPVERMPGSARPQRSPNDATHGTHAARVTQHTGRRHVRQTTTLAKHEMKAKASRVRSTTTEDKS